MSEPVLGIICGGGPAPGLNGLIAAVTFYAKRLGWRVFGFHDGYLHLSSGDADAVRRNIIELDQKICARHYREGGSIIRTDRFDPTRSPRRVANVLQMLAEFRVKYLLIVGGNDKITCTHLITQGVDPHEMQVIVVPKTIDNDIALPGDQDTFGYDSARLFATELVKNLMVDAKSAPRFFCVETMGKRTGHLALSVAEASGAHVCIIPEDFGDKKIELKDICDIFEGAIIKRLAMGKPYGMCVISEGLINQMTSNSIQGLFENGYIKYGAEGQIVLDDAELSRAVSKQVNQRLTDRGISVRVTPKKIGYELRSQSPNAFDAVYVQELGYGAVEGFRSGHSNCIALWDNGMVSYKSFRELMDPGTGRIFPRRVNIESQCYKITRTYLSVLKERDFQDKEKLEKLAKAANTTPDQFIAQFGRVPALTVK